MRHVQFNVLLVSGRQFHRSTTRFKKENLKTSVLKRPFTSVASLFLMLYLGVLKQFGRMPVLEEARTIDYVTNHNVITIDHHGDEHFQNIKNGGRALRARGISG